MSKIRRKDTEKSRGPNGQIKIAELDTFVDETERSFRESNNNKKSHKTKSCKINSLLRKSHVNVNVNQLMEQRTVASLHPRTATTTRVMKVSNKSINRKTSIEPQ